MKRCKVCSARKPLSEFHKRSVSKDGYNAICKPCVLRAAKENRHKYAERIRRYNRKYASQNPAKVRRWNRAGRERNLEQRLWREARVRARRRGTPFTITVGDITVPRICEALGMNLAIGEGNSQPNSPSLDAIIPSLGYVPGNIAVISHRANTIKSNATPEELRRIADWIERRTTSVASSLSKQLSKQIRAYFKDF